jgi:hypothetical protein
VLGNEIGIVTKEVLPPGTYEREWNGESLPSGIYFYRMSAGEFVYTRKMILIK